MVSRETIRLFRNRAKALNFETCDPFYVLSETTSREIYNGVGSDWMPKKWRKRLTKYYKFFLPAVLEHDISFEYSNKTRASFVKANERLLSNCLKMVAAIPWKKHKRYKIRRYCQAYCMYHACVWFGWGAWTDSK